MAQTPKEALFAAAYHAGRQARDQGRLLSSNPHSSHHSPALYAAWSNGWLDRDDELVAKI